MSGQITPQDEPVDESEWLGPVELRGETTDDGRGRIFPCERCGADLEFHIGSQHLKCPYCGFEKQIEIEPGKEVAEQNFEEMLERIRLHHDDDRRDEEGKNEIRCESCGGTVVFVGPLTSTSCPYCGSPIQRENVHTATHRIPVDGVMPFLIEESQALASIKQWVSSLWFAPSSFTRRGVAGRTNGVYLPYWTFDTLTFNDWAGKRGDHYTVRRGVGKNRRTVRKTRWSSRSGQFQEFFDDVLVVAAQGMPPKFMLALDPWPLDRCFPFTQQVLAGHFARTYDVELEEGFRNAKQRIDAAIAAEVSSRIGGDTQRISRIDTKYEAITFKHLLLPVWMMAYRYQDKPYRVFINAATGEVQGERPYSWVKITLTVLLGLLIFGGAFLLFSS